MIRSLFSAATGMRAQQLNIDTIANNLANIQTAGFKRSRAVFEDLFYQELQAAGSLTAAGINNPTGIQIGLGVQTVGIQKLFEVGSFKYTANEFDMAIAGEGFLKVLLPDGTEGYTKQGIFMPNANGEIVSPQGYTLMPGFTLPADTVSVSIAIDGTFTAYVGNDTAGQNLGQISLTTFINPAGLKSLGDNVYIPTDSSGPAVEGIPGEDGKGTIRQYFVEMSNVNAAEEMVDMITAQRAYEMDAKTIQTSDEMLQIANGLKR